MLHVIILFFVTLDLGNGQSLTNTLHRTQAAAEKINDLWCYACDTMEVGENCTELSMNRSALIKKCKADEFICMVKQFSYTTSTENSTSGPKMWSLERKCAVNCESGCIVIGERTKLYACTSCCENSLCNSGRGDGVSVHSPSNNLLYFFLGLKYLQLLHQLLKPRGHILNQYSLLRIFIIK